MQLYIQYANKKQFIDSYQDIFETKTEEDVKEFLKKLEYKDWKVSFQYETLYQAVSNLKDSKFFGKNIESNVKWFYFGNDTCEHLIPTLDEMNDFFKEILKLNKDPNSSNKKTMTLVTPPVGNFWISKLRTLFDYLQNNVRESTEVVVNDFWVLYIINKEYDKLKPILGRLLNKAQRNPLVWDKKENVDPQVPSFLWKEIYEKIKNNQYEYYDSNPINLDIFTKSFKKYWISRFWVDNVGLWLNKEIKNDFWVDIYYPYATVAHGRNCATAWIVDKTREWYVQDLPCPRYCQKFDILLKAWINDKWITQRGNGVWKRHLNLEKIHSTILTNKENRLVFSPFIPV